LIVARFKAIIADMAKLLEEIQAEALRLSAEDRETLAGALLQSLDDAPLGEIDEAWISEAERRYEEWRTGKTSAIAGETFFSDLRRELGCD
jgi:putative addiction module component (TIGR02574 family)